VSTLHRGKNPIRSMLHGEMQMIDKLGNFSIHINQAVSKFNRVRCCITNTVDAINCCNAQ